MASQKYSQINKQNQGTVVQGDGAIGTQNVTHGGTPPGVATTSSATEEEQLVPDLGTGKEYDMKKGKGYALIINVKAFTHSTWKGNIREGTDEDRDAMNKLLTWLGFQVKIYNDGDGLDRHEIEDKIDDFVQDIATKYSKDVSCSALVLLSHGDKGKIYASDDRMNEPGVDIEQLVDKFRECKALHAKPKLFFVQACRGGKYDSGVEADAGTVAMSGDVLEGYSTTKGYKAWRTVQESAGKKKGSYYIKTLTKVFEEMVPNNTEIVEMMREVQYRMNLLMMNNKYHQAPEFCSSLVRRLCFTPQTQ